ncbi:MAG: thymidine phosphorylase [Verrucomicrobiota bacterium]
MHVPSIIEKKRDGKELSEEEIRFVISAYTAEEMPDYQMSALAMAIYLKGMNADETTALTRAMLDSGEILTYPDAAPRVVDKHSTGGVGDKVSLVLAPLLACAGFWVPMISGRGLGITGGTLDKLESIPGFRVGLSTEELMHQLDEISVAMVGQTASICPADKKLYALRDVTATVSSQPLIVASIMSKKLAESLDALVLDVKYGTGAFMKARSEAASLGIAMQEVGEAMGVETSVCFHTMDEPLGRAVGNSLEVVEAIETLKGEGPADLLDTVMSLAKRIFRQGEKQLGQWLQDGTALRKFEEMVEAQGGDLEAMDKLGALHEAPVIREMKAEESGVIAKMDAEIFGRASVALGAGRSLAEDDVDPAVGFDEIAKVGADISVGEILCRIHARSEADAEEAEVSLRKGMAIS